MQYPSLNQMSQRSCQGGEKRSLKQQIAGSFGAQADHYEQHAAFQRICGDRLLSYISDQPRQRVIDLGCGTGYFLPALSRQAVQLVGLDLSSQMVNHARKGHLGESQFCVADIETLPFTDNAFELAFSNLVLQWCTDLPRTLSEIHRVIQPGGELVFSILLDGSLRELQQSWQGIDNFRHVNDFIHLEMLQQCLVDSPFANYRLSHDSVTMRYQSFRQIRQDLKGIGANLVVENRRQSVLTRRQVQQLNRGYESFRLPDGDLPATYQVAWVVLRK